MTTAEMSYGRDDVISRKELKPYMARTNWHGAVSFFTHMALLGGTGYGVWVSLGTWWVVPAMIAYSLMMAFLFNPVHECSHGTVFRSRWMNETVYWIVCLIYMVPPTFFRYAHAAHHTYTQIRGKDPDMMPERMTVAKYLYILIGVTFWTRNILWFLRHPFGSIAAGQKYYLPESETPRVVTEARIIFVLYGAIAVASLYTGSWFAVIFWVLPRLIGEPSMRAVRIAEHGECAETADLRENTRSTMTDAVIRFLFWNMPYHSEHHLCPMVPFHALGRLHERVKAQLHPVGENYVAVHTEILGKVSAHQGVTWQNATQRPTDVAMSQK